MRRTSGGLCTGEPGHVEQPACRDGDGGGSDAAAGERVYITVDGQRSTANFLRVRLLRGQELEAGVRYSLSHGL